MSSRENSNNVVQRRATTTDTLPREKLPDDLQKLVDNEESLYDKLYDGTASQSTNSSIRYAAYASRARTILMSAHRYVAYTSDIGESFRPVAYPWLVKGAYGVSWAYLVGDVSYEGYRAYLRNQRMRHPGVPGIVSARLADATTSEPFVPKHVPAIEDWKSVVVQRAVFQGVASMGLPAFTIHSIVKYSGKALKNTPNKTVRTWGPIGLGLAAVPFLPYLFDKPVEEAVEWSFYKAFEAIGGPDAVKHSRIMEKVDESRAAKEKEL